MRKEIPLTLETIHRDGDEKYRISSPREIQLTLHAIAQKKAIAVLYFNNDQNFIKTLLLAVTAEGIWLDVGPSEDDNQMLLNSLAVNLVTMHQGVKVQLACYHGTLAMYAASPAFYFTLPQHLYRFQRRNFFRLLIPVEIDLKCLIPPAKPEAEQQHEVVIMDISVGGIALQCKESSANLVAGEIYHDCKIDLPEIGTLIATIQVKNLFEVISPTGHISKHAGCEFINLDGKMSMLLQRYVGIMQSKLSKTITT